MAGAHSELFHPSYHLVAVTRTSFQMATPLVAGARNKSFFSGLKTLLTFQNFNHTVAEMCPAPAFDPGAREVPSFHDCRKVSSFKSVAQHNKEKENLSVSEMPKGCDEKDLVCGRMHSDFIVNSLFFSIQSKSLDAELLMCFIMESGRKVSNMQSSMLKKCIFIYLEFQIILTLYQTLNLWKKLRIWLYKCKTLLIFRLKQMSFMKKWGNSRVRCPGLEFVPKKLGANAKHISDMLVKDFTSLKTKGRLWK